MDDIIMDVDGDGVDPAEDQSWLRRWDSDLEQADEQYDILDDEEKVCNEVEEGTRRFSRIFGVKSNGSVIVPGSYHPGVGSPSHILKKDDKKLLTAFHSTNRIQMAFEMTDNKVNHFLGTCFSVSPTVAITARHCLDKKDAKLLEVLGHQGSFVHNDSFDGNEEWKGQDMWVEGDMPANRDKSGLFQTGMDVAYLKTSKRFDHFLLPCSPSYSPSIKENIAALSYPGVTNFLRDCKDEIYGPDIYGHICTTYKSLLDLEIEDLVVALAKERNVTIDSLKHDVDFMASVYKTAKQSLLDQLISFFNKFRSGALVCSVGRVVCENPMALGTNMSTLRGSSGAAVCPLEFDGYFFGVHGAGSLIFDMNVATSTDNEDFVKVYCRSILDTLPPCGDTHWNSVNLDPFKDWLLRHKDHLKHDSSWYKMTFFKKPDEHDEDNSDASSSSICSLGSPSFEVVS